MTETKCNNIGGSERPIEREREREREERVRGRIEREKERERKKERKRERKIKQGNTVGKLNALVLSYQRGLQ